MPDKGCRLNLSQIDRVNFGRRCVVAHHYSALSSLDHLSCIGGYNIKAAVFSCCMVKSIKTNCLVKE